MYPTADGKPVTDLRQDEIEILDEGALQKIDRFEHVMVRGARSQETRREPATVAEMREATQDVRARLFVLFLDTEHVEFGSALNIKSPLIQSLNQLIGGDDLVAVMTAGMEARDLTFRRRTTSIEELLKTVWSERDYRLKRSAEEDEIALCFPDAAIADEMIFRRREVRTLDALEKLVVHLRFVREERKAVIAISQGWRLYGDDPVLRRPVDGKPVEPVPPLGNDPRTGRLGVVERVGTDVFDRRKCEQERLSREHAAKRPALLRYPPPGEHRQHQLLSDRPSRSRRLRRGHCSHLSFRPLEADRRPCRGFAAAESAQRLAANDGREHRRPRRRAERRSLRRYAAHRRGSQLVLSARATTPLGDLDGKFHRLTVRVKRPGVRVRARTGYLAATRGDEAKAKAAATAVAAAKPVDARAEAVKGSLSTLGIFSRERPLRVHVASGYLPSGAATIWGVAEVPAATGQHDWIEGGQADAMLIDSTGRTILTEHLTIAPGVRSLRFALGSGATLAPGDYQVQIRAKGTAASLGAMESVRVSLAAAPIANGAVLMRRSVTTGNQAMPTADLRFRRTERISIEIPTTSTDAGTAQLLNRVGQAMSIPVTAAIRDDADGSRWRTAQLALAPLAAGDYVVEQSGGAETTLTAFRVLP